MHTTLARNYRMAADVIIAMARPARNAQTGSPALDSAIEAIKTNATRQLERHLRERAESRRRSIRRMIDNPSAFWGALAWRMIATGYHPHTTASLAADAHKARMRHRAQIAAGRLHVVTPGMGELAHDWEIIARYFRRFGSRVWTRGGRNA